MTKRQTKTQQPKDQAPAPETPVPETPAPAGRLKITAKRDGFRRAGRAWPAAGIEVDPNELTDEQIAALKAEPMLVVETIEA